MSPSSRLADFDRRQDFQLMHDSLTELALAAREGDQLALVAFVRGTQHDVVRLCAVLADPQVADDLAQETYLRALQALRRYRGEASARTWLLSIARKTVADHHRRAPRSVRHLREADDRPDPSADPTADAEITALLRELEPDRRTAFVLTQLIGLDYAEAARVCGCPVGTIRSRVARARSQLLELFIRPDRTMRATGDFG
jgi:RNA polymerase sigma-70 factor, ECF subfamily